MQKIYSLLRDNKQSGPFTLEELVALSLKQHDLIWAEGKTAGWSYPDEVPELKSFLATASIVKSNANPPLKNKTNKAPDDKHASVIGRHVFVSLPGNASIGSGKEKPIIKKEEVIAEQAKSEDEEESPEAKLERKARELRDRIQAFSEKKNLPKVDNDLDIKYARSLDDIKEEYSSWMHQQKKKKTFPLKPVLIASAAVIFLVVGLLGAKAFFSNAKTIDTALIANPPTTRQQAELQDENNEEVIATDNKKQNKPSVERSSAKKSSVQQPLKSVSETDEIDRYVDSLIQADRKREEAGRLYEEIKQQHNEEVKVEAAAHDVVKVSSVEPSAQPSAKEKKSTTRTQQAIDEAIRIIEKLSENGKKEKAITLLNGSNLKLKFVAVDVFYYKANKELLQKQTVYFHDISAGGAATMLVPDLKKAASTKYQLGLISSEKGLYYAKQ